MDSRTEMNILIGLIEHMGDIVACEPVPRYLKRTYSNANVSWAVLKHYKELIDFNPYIDDTIVIDCLTEWIKLKNHGVYDLVVDLHVNYRICQCCKVPLFKTTGNPLVTVHNWFDYGTLLEAFSMGAGLPQLSEQPNVYISNEHIEKVNKLGVDYKYLVIHRQSNDLNKDWQDIKWNKILNQIISDYNLKVVEVGTGAAAPLDLPSHSYINLINKTGILECAEIIKRSCLFLGVDSGPAHLANAVNTKGVVLLGSLGNFKSYNPFSGGYGEQQTNVRLVRNRLGPVAEIPIGKVMEAVEQSLIEADVDQSPDNSELGNSSRQAPLTEEIMREGISMDSSRGDSQHKTDYPKVLAFYLPQFHPIPENDAAWGRGFTEWTNVTKARPLFQGHDQPRLPGELGFYDLRVPETIEKQVSLAIEHGIAGFCFYYYYFQGRRYLYKPIDIFMSLGFKIPFCFLWANENWTKRWDGGQDDIILRQQHSAEDNINFIKGLIPIFRKDSYIKIHGKPILLIYKTHLIPNIKFMAEQWRNIVKREGFDGIFLVHVDDWLGVNAINPKMIDFDAAYEIPSNLLPPAVMIRDVSSFRFLEPFHGSLVDYEKFAQLHMHRPFPEYKRFRTVMLPWDNTPRYENRAIIHLDANPRGEAYKKWLLNAYVDTYRQYEGDERIMFVHSWNEWCEGTNLEPDQKNGRKYLEITKEIIENAKQIISLGQNNNITFEEKKTLFEYLRQKDETSFWDWKMMEQKPEEETSRIRQLLLKAKTKFASSKLAWGFRILGALRRLPLLENQVGKIQQLEWEIAALKEPPPRPNFSFSWEVAADNLLARAERRVRRRVIDLTGEEKKSLFYSFWSETCGEDYEEKRRAQYKSYLPHLTAGLPYPFVDIGCGAGEFVDFLNNHNIPAIGVDREAGEVSRASARGWKIIHADGLTFLKESDEPLAGVSLLEVAEHLAPQEVFELLQVAAARLAPGGVLLIEGINARHPYFVQDFYNDPTHIRPVTDEYLVFLMQWAGLMEIKKILDRKSVV